MEASRLLKDTFGPGQIRLLRRLLLIYRTQRRYDKGSGTFDDVVGDLFQLSGVDLLLEQEQSESRALQVALERFANDGREPNINRLHLLAYLFVDARLTTFEELASNDEEAFAQGTGHRMSQYLTIDADQEPNFSEFLGTFVSFEKDETGTSVRRSLTLANDGCRCCLNLTISAETVTERNRSAKIKPPLRQYRQNFVGWASPLLDGGLLAFARSTYDGKSTVHLIAAPNPAKVGSGISMTVHKVSAKYPKIQIYARSSRQKDTENERMSRLRRYGLDIY